MNISFIASALLLLLATRLRGSLDTTIESGTDTPVIDPGSNTNNQTPSNVITNDDVINATLISLDTNRIDDIIDIVNTWNVYGDGDIRKLCYILATAFHESRVGLFMTEISSGEQYEFRQDLGNVYPGDGPLYKGRGYVQITGRVNYQKFSSILGIDLISQPTLATVPQYAARIMIHGMINGSFTGVSLSNYINSFNADYINARRVVNGTDRSSLIAGYCTDILNQLNLPA